MSFKNWFASLQYFKRKNIIWLAIITSKNRTWDFTLWMVGGVLGTDSLLRLRLIPRLQPGLQFQQKKCNIKTALSHGGSADGARSLDLEMQCAGGRAGARPPGGILSLFRFF